MADQSSAPGSIWNRRQAHDKSKFISSQGHHNHSRHNHNHHHGHHNREHNNHHNHNHHHFQKDEVDQNGQRVVKSKVGNSILEDSWTVWFLHRGPGVKISNYLQATKQVGTFSTVEEFWDVYSHLRRIDKLPFTSEFQIFKKNVRPMWEDPANAEGGKWIVRLRRPSKGKKTEEEEEAVLSEEEAAKLAAEKNAQHIKCRQKAALYWENLLLNIIGGKLIRDGDESLVHEIMGIVISARRDEDIISVWTRNGNNTEGNNAIRDAIQAVLELPEGFEFEYKVHQESIKEGAEKQAIYEQQHHHHQHHHNQHHGHKQRPNNTTKDEPKSSSISPQPAQSAQVSN